MEIIVYNHVMSDNDQQCTNKTKDMLYPYKKVNFEDLKKELGENIDEYRIFFLHLDENDVLDKKTEKCLVVIMSETNREGEAHYHNDENKGVGIVSCTEYKCSEIISALDNIMGNNKEGLEEKLHLFLKSILNIDGKLTPKIFVKEFYKNFNDTSSIEAKEKEKQKQYYLDQYFQSALSKCLDTETEDAETKFDDEEKEDKVNDVKIDPIEGLKKLGFEIIEVENNFSKENDETDAAQ